MWITLIASLTEATDQAFRWPTIAKNRLAFRKDRLLKKPTRTTFPRVHHYLTLLWRRKDFLIVVVLLLYAFELMLILQYILVKCMACTVYIVHEEKQTNFKEKENKHVVIFAHKSTPYALISKNTLHLNKRIFI